MPRSLDRLAQRRNLLLTQHDRFQAAAAACAAVWTQGQHRRPKIVSIRTPLIKTTPMAAHTLSNDLRPKQETITTFLEKVVPGNGLASAGAPPPISQLIVPRGIALQLYLVALYEAQCSRRPTDLVRNQRPLLATETVQIGWLDLVASHETRAPVSLQQIANRLRQLKNSLTGLEKAKLIALKSGQSNRRFEQFQLLNECGQLSYTGDPIPYHIPNRDSDLVELPSDFFMKGWVHVLSPAEIATYLMLRHLSKNYPGKHEIEGIFATEEQREQSYWIGRDTYESHLLLARYGLIEKMKDPTRRPDGRIANYAADRSLQPHRFRINPDVVFAQPAINVIVEALDK